MYSDMEERYKSNWHWYDYLWFTPLMIFGIWLTFFLAFLFCGTFLGCQIPKMWRLETYFNNSTVYEGKIVEEDGNKFLEAELGEVDTTLLEHSHTYIIDGVDSGGILLECSDCGDKITIRIKN